MSAAEVEAVLAEHQFIERGRVYDTCGCGWYGGGYTVHLAGALAPLIERARAEGAVEGLRWAENEVHREARYLYGLHPSRRPDIFERLAMLRSVITHRVEGVRRG